MKTDSPREAAELLEIPAEAIPIFAKTEALLQKEYGASPSVQALMRLWLTCATTATLRREFEEGVAGTAAGALVPDENGHYDERSL